MARGKKFIEAARKEGGRVTLTGAVNSNIEKVKAESIARSTFGVFSVENRLRTDS